MEPAKSIARLGFRRWYERQLIESFAWLTTCLLSGVLFAAIVELVGFATPGLAFYVTLVVLYVVGLMAVNTFMRFWKRFERAQIYARLAVCPACRAYGLFDVIDPAGRAAVRCRRCGHDWRLEPPAPSNG